MRNAEQTSDAEPKRKNLARLGRNRLDDSLFRFSLYRLFDIYMQDTIRRILTARVYDVAEETPLDPLRRLSARLNRPVLLKREDLQPVFSFKIRGAYNKIAGLSEAELARGVLCASAGNHAQGVALAAARRNTSATIVMPTTTPGIKVAAVRALGGEVVLHGDSFDAAYAYARDLERKTRAVFIHPFDDPEVIAGQGTVGLEIARQHADPIQAVFVPIGGGDWPPASPPS